MTARSLEAYYQQLDAGLKPIMMMTAATASEHRWRLDLQGGIEAGRYDLSRIIEDPSRSNRCYNNGNSAA